MRKKRKQRNGLLDLFSTSTSYSVKKPLATKSSTGSLGYKGHKIWRTGDGEFEVPSIEKGTRFDTVGDAKKFIGYWEKQRNPGMGKGKWLKCKAIRRLKNGAIQILK